MGCEGQLLTVASPITRKHNLLETEKNDMVEGESLHAIPADRYPGVPAFLACSGVWASQVCTANTNDALEIIRWYRQAALSIRRTSRSS